MYRLTNNTEVYASPDRSDVLVIKRGTGEMYRFACNDHGEFLLNALDRASGAVIADPAQLDASAAFHLWKELGLLTEQPAPDYDAELRSLHQVLLDLGVNPADALSKISAISVAVIGVGGTGGWVADQLASIGFHNLTLIDGDRVEASNLIRQIYDREDIGQFKVEALAAHLQAKYRSMCIRAVSQFIVTDSDLGPLIGDCQIVMIAADVPSRAEAACLIGNWCLKENKIHIVCGGYSSHNGALGITVVPGETPCWNCYLAETARQTPLLATPDRLIAKGFVNTSGLLPLIQMAAAASSLEALRIGLGLPPIFNGKHVDFCFTEWISKERRFSAASDCPWCGKISHD